MTTTLHWGVDSRSDMFRTTIDPEYTSSTEKRTCWKWDSASSLASDFHVYAMEWTPEEFHFSIDGNETGWMRPPNGGFAQIAGLDPKDNVWNDKADNVRMAPFDKPVSWPYAMPILSEKHVNYISFPLCYKAVC